MSEQETRVIFLGEGSLGRTLLSEVQMYGLHEIMDLVQKEFPDTLYDFHGDLPTSYPVQGDYDVLDTIKYTCQALPKWDEFRGELRGFQQIDCSDDIVRAVIGSVLSPSDDALLTPLGRVSDEYDSYDYAFRLPGNNRAVLPLVGFDLNELEIYRPVQLYAELTGTTRDNIVTPGGIIPMGNGLIEYKKRGSNSGVDVFDVRIRGESKLSMLAEEVAKLVPKANVFFQDTQFPEHSMWMHQGYLWNASEPIVLDTPIPFPEMLAFSREGL